MDAFSVNKRRSVAINIPFSCKNVVELPEQVKRDGVLIFIGGKTVCLEDMKA